jgi:hypothetical protein
MRLAGLSGDVLTMRVTGYQFPDAEDLRQRFSWHLVQGDANCAQGAWTFRYPALTCEESPRISAWLDRVADLADPYSGTGEPASPPGALAFTEPDLSFRVAGYPPGRAVLEVALDLEFQPPWHRRRGIGDPFRLIADVTAAQLRAAAATWYDEIASYPDSLLP